MLQMMSGIFFVIFICFSALTQNSLAQIENKSDNIKGVIKGRIVDADSLKPVIGASVALFRYSDSTVETGEYSDRNGNFELKNIKAGNYYLRISYIGYREREYRPILISEKKSTFSFPQIKLESKSVSTEGIEVTAEKELMLNSVDKKIFFVEKSIASMGGSAVDVMRTIPSVSVDIDGNVSLRGSQNVQVLIDGKPSGMSSAEILDMLPASSIERIEIMTNPSAKYNPEGMSGIINIVMKKEKSAGFNGMASVNVGTGDKYNTSLNLNLRTDGFNFFINYSSRWFAMTGTGNSNQENFYQDSTFYLNQNSDFRRNGNFNNFKIGVDYTLFDNHTITLAALYNFGQRNSDEFLKYYYLNNSKELYNYYERTSDEQFPNHGFDYSLGYKWTLGKKMHELTADIFYSPAWRDFSEAYRQEPFLIDSTHSIIQADYPFSYQRTNSNNQNYNLTAQMDYGLPFETDSRLETGWKTTFRQADMNYRYENGDSTGTIWYNDANKTNHFVYGESIFAVYGMFSDKSGIFSYQLGLRAEYTETKSDQKTLNIQNNKSYTSLFPTAHLKFDFSSMQSFQLSYSRRINRPNYRELNPFIDYDDPLNLESGNPDLNPEYINSFEIGHTLLLSTTIISSNIFYRQNDGSVEDVRKLIDSNVTFSQPQNIANVKNYGLELTVQRDLTKWWRMDGSLSYFRSEVHGSFDSIDLSANSYNWNAKFNTFLSINKTLEIQLSGWYNSPSVFPQGKMQKMYSADHGIKLSTFDDNLSFNFRLSDIFNTMRHNSESYSKNFYISSERKRASRVAYLGITYKFNDYKLKREKRSDGDRDIFEVD